MQGVATFPAVFSLSKLSQGFEENLTRREAITRAENRAIGLLYGENTKILHDLSGAPYLKLPKGKKRSFSLSHSHSMLALLDAPPDYSVGVDVEEFRSQIIRVAPRVMNPSEIALAGSFTEIHPEQTVIRTLTRIWCAKEAVFKSLVEFSPSFEFREDYLVRTLECHRVWLEYRPFPNSLFEVGVFEGRDWCLAWVVFFTSSLKGLIV